MNLSIFIKYLQPIKLFLLGAVCVLGFAPFYLYPLSIASLSGLFYYWHQAKTPKQAAKAGFIYAMGLFSGGIYWIYISLHDFGGMPMLMAGLATFLLCAFMALFTALVGALSVWIANVNVSNGSAGGLIKTNSFIRLVAFPLFWGLADWTRSWIFTGFPWLTMGYSQVPYSPLSGYMPIVGVYGVSIIAVFIASLIGWYLVKFKALEPRTKNTNPAYGHRNTFTFIFLIMAGGSLLKLVDWTTPVGQPISVALLQGNIAQEVKWAPETALHTINQYLTMAEASKAKLIIMPETALPFISSDVPMEIKKRLELQAIKNQGDILVGLVEFEQGEYFNSMLSIGSAPPNLYRKSHLVPFGEFIPFKAVFGWIYRDWLNMPLSDLSRGSIHQQPMHIAGAKVAVNICYEDVFGEEIIRQLPQATLLVNVSNDAWYGESIAAYQHLQFSQARALETGRMMLRATNNGATAIINPDGHVVAHAPHFTKTTLNGMAQGYSGSTPYVRYGNALFLTFCFIAIGCMVMIKILLMPKFLSKFNFLVGKGKTK